jgi:hypothetical protein
MATWVELTLDKKRGDAPAGTKVYVNLDQAGLICRRGKGSDIWFSPDTRELAVTTNELEWDGHTYVTESPPEIVKKAKNADRT